MDKIPIILKCNECQKEGLYIGENLHDFYCEEHLKQIKVKEKK